MTLDAPYGSCLSVGDYVAATVRAGTAPLRNYVGRIEAVDDRGIRLTLMDWLVSSAIGNDLFVPWSSLETTLVDTSGGGRETFLASAKNYQSRMNGADRT